MFPLSTDPLSESDSEESESEGDEEHIPDPDKAGVLLPVTLKAVDTLSACLSRPRICNAVVLKLLNQVRQRPCASKKPAHAICLHSCQAEAECSCWLRYDLPYKCSNGGAGGPDESHGRPPLRP